MISAKPIPALAGVRGILFDFGGTLDGDGLHWLERFFELYPRVGLRFSWEQVRAAFDEAERQLWSDPKMRRASLDEMVERHVAIQFAQLQVQDAVKQRDLTQKFVRAIRQTATRNAATLEELAARGFRLGVISNGCGNTTLLCQELGFAPYLETILDSTEVGLRKPDPRFFVQAAEAIQLEPREILMIGDSIERDIQPARSLGMGTAWMTTSGREIAEANAVLYSLGEVINLLPRSTKSPTRIKAGIFAAGQGSRLRSAGLLKPLVKIGDRSLVVHVLEGFARIDVSEVVIIINEDSLAVQERVNKCDWPFALQWIVKTTSTSMESFIRVVEALAADGNRGPFLLSTVDTILPPNVLENFLIQARENASDLTLAINVPAEDDNPLWVRCEKESPQICALDETAAGSGLATAGVYLVRPTILREAASARRDRLSSLRQFLVRLLERGYSIGAVRIANSIDVDRPLDIIAAEELVRQKAS